MVRIDDAFLAEIDALPRAEQSRLFDHLLRRFDGGDLIGPWADECDQRERDLAEGRAHLVPAVDVVGPF